MTTGSIDNHPNHEGLQKLDSKKNYDERTVQAGWHRNVDFAKFSKAQKETNQ
jgi:hypothetical protein